MKYHKFISTAYKSSAARRLLLLLFCPLILSCCAKTPSSVDTEPATAMTENAVKEGSGETGAKATAEVNAGGFMAHEVTATVVRDWRRWGEQSFTLSVSPVSKEEAREFTWAVKKDGVLIDAPHANWPSLDPLTSWRKETQSILLHVRFGLSEEGSDYTLPRDLRETFEVELVGGPAHFAEKETAEGRIGIDEICHGTLTLQPSEDTDINMQIIPLGEGVSFINETNGEEGRLTELRIIDGIVWAGFVFPDMESLEGLDFNASVLSPDELEQGYIVYREWHNSLPELTLYYEDGTDASYGVTSLRPSTYSDGIFLRTCNLPAVRNGARLVRVSLEGKSFDIFLSRIR
ncbi:MAG: hypothetical protein IK016_09290 [Lachnospiraceae bacterium]|nr:hypothetical protein [Lachnospiraceae bacterium]